MCAQRACFSDRIDIGRDKGKGKKQVTLASCLSYLPSGPAASDIVTIALSSPQAIESLHLPTSTQRNMPKALSPKVHPTTPARPYDRPNTTSHKVERSSPSESNDSQPLVLDKSQKSIDKTHTHPLTGKDNGSGAAHGIKSETGHSHDTKRSTKQIRRAPHLCRSREPFSLHSIDEIKSSQLPNQEWRIILDI